MVNVEAELPDVELGSHAGGRDRFNLYKEVRGPMGGAFFMFLMADVRTMAKNGELKGNPEYIQKLIEFPINGYEFITLYQENRDAIEKRIDSKDRYEMYASLFAVPQDADPDAIQAHLQSMEMIHFEDAHLEEECVFGIGINNLYKRVTVAFRGSVTPTDFEQDAKAYFEPIPNPVQIVEGMEASIDPQLLRRRIESVKVHRGFREYLYGDTQPFSMPLLLKRLERSSAKCVEIASKTKEAIAAKGLDPSVLLLKKETLHRVSEQEVDAETVNDDNRTNASNEGGTNVHDDGGAVKVNKKKYEVILEMVAAVLKANPGHELYVCGFSLGGALALLLAFEAAAASDDFIPKPVTCITTGAPKVGNLDFLLAFELLEEQKKIRYMRVTNYRDIVTLIPPGHEYNCIAAAFCQQRRFRHVGLRLKLFPTGYAITYAPKMRTCPGILCCDLIKILHHYLFLAIICQITCFCKNLYIYRAFRSEHTELVYMNRFDACQGVLEELQLDDLYEERSARSRFRLPVLRANTHTLKRDEEGKRKPYMTFAAILEV